MTHDDPDEHYESIVAQLLASHDRRNETSSGIAETRVRQAAFDHDRKVVLMAMGWGSSTYERDSRRTGSPLAAIVVLAIAILIGWALAMIFYMAWSSL